MELSVVIVARNEEKNIARCIESILKHTATAGPVEVLLADSASTDRTVEIAMNYPINIISLKAEWPLSPAAGRFSGVNNVSGEYVLIIDGDMELLPGWIEKALMFMKARPQVASVVGRHYEIWETPQGNRKKIDGPISRRTEIVKISYVFCSSLFRRSFLLKAGNFQPFLRAEEEAEMSYRLRREGYELYYLPEDSINHYSIPRNTFKETIRRFHKNLWAGMGDMFSWCLRNGYCSILWMRFRRFIFFSGMIILMMLGLLWSICIKNGWLALESVSLLVSFMIFMCIKKRNVYQGILTTTNIACITWSFWTGLTRKIPAIEKYPRDVIKIKSVLNDHESQNGPDIKEKSIIEKPAIYRSSSPKSSIERIREVSNKIRIVYQNGGMESVVGKVLRAMMIPLQGCIPPVLFVKLETFFITGYWPNLKQPRSFSEKTIFRKIYKPHPLSTLVSDKWAVREYVLSKTKRTGILNEVYFVTDAPKDIPFDKLPDKFVIKATHGSGWNIIVLDKTKIDREKIILQCDIWMNSKYDIYSKNFSEKHYNQIIPRIIIEKFIEDPVFGIPLDFKFYCFNGKPCYIQVDIDRFCKHRRNYYDLDWKEMDFRYVVHKGKLIPKPILLDDMAKIAATLSSDFDFCRVDLYNPNKDTIIFGEITLISQSGLGRFYPREWDYRFGDLWPLKLNMESNADTSGQ